MDPRIEEKFVNGGRFLPVEIDAVLLDEAERYAAAYEGDFPFMVDLKRQLRRGRFSAAQAKGSLNVLLSDLRREAEAKPFRPVPHARPSRAAETCPCSDTDANHCTNPQGGEWGSLAPCYCYCRCHARRETHRILDQTPEFDPEDQLRREEGQWENEHVNEPADRLEQALAWLK